MKRLFMRLMGVDPRECAEVRALMSDHVDGELDTDGRRRVDKHVRRCRRCRRVLANLQQTLARLRLLGQAAPPEADDPDAVAERVSRGWRERA